MRALADFGNDAIDYKALVTRWTTEVWNLRREETVDEMMAPDGVVEVEGSDTSLTVEGFKQYRRAFLNAVPDLWVDVLSVTTEGPSSVQHWRARGTHLGPGLGIPASGRQVDFTGLSSYRFSGRMIVHGLDRWNRGEMIASLMQVRMDELKAHARLTSREAQVALLMAERLRHTEIAGQLRISPNTARRHCERVLRKLGVGRREEVAKALGKVPGSVLARQGDDLHPLTQAAGGAVRQPPA